MKLVCAPSGDHRNASRLEVRPQLAGFDEVVLLGLRRIELQREGIPTEVIQRVAEARGTRGIDGEHVFALWVTIRNDERLRLEPPL